MLARNPASTKASRDRAPGDSDEAGRADGKFIDGRCTDGTGPTLKREAVAGAAGCADPVTSRHGVAHVCAASDNRRAAVRSAAGITPITRAAAPDRIASSIDHSASTARAVSTSSRPEGSRPSSARPGPWSRPHSAACADDQHQTISGARPPVGSPLRSVSRVRHARRRTARRSAKPMASASAAAAPPWPATGPALPAEAGLIS